MFKKITFLLAFLASTLSLPQAQASVITPQSLAKKIAKTGKGCDGKLVIKSEILGGRSTECTFNNEPVSITVYQSKFYKEAIKVACALEIGVITITDGKRWIVTPSSRASAKSLAKPLGGKVKVLCNSKNIINETYQSDISDQDQPAETAAPAPSSPPAPKPGSIQLPFKLGETAKVENFTVSLLSSDDKSSQQVCVATGGFGDLCGYNYEAEGDNQRFFVKPGATKKYILFEMSFTNQGNSAQAPGTSLIFKFTDQTGLLLNETYIGDINQTNSSLIPGGVLKTKIGFILDQSVDISNLKLSVAPFFGEPIYFSTR